MNTVPAVTISTTPNPVCLSRDRYTIQPSDDIQVIAVAHNITAGPLKTINSTFPDYQCLCSWFAGQDLCLPQICPIYLVRPNNNCAVIAVAHGITFPQLVSYNPAINMDRTNLIVDTNICIGPSGSMYNSPTTIPGATSGFATATVAPPGATPFGTTINYG